MVLSSRNLVDRLSRTSIRYRLMLFFAAGLVPILALSIYFSYQVYRAQERQVLLGHMTTAEATARAVSEFIDGIVRAQNMIGLSIERQILTPDQMSSYLAAAQDSEPVLHTIGFANQNGDIIAGTPVALLGSNIADRPYFREVTAGRTWAVSNLLRARGTEIYAFIVSHRLERNGRFAGVLISAISPSALEQFISSRASPTIDYGILDSRGFIIATTILTEDQAVKNENRSRIPSVDRALRGHPAYAEPFTDPADDVEKMGASVPIPQFGWVVNVLEPVSTATAPIRRAAVANILLLTFIIAILLLLIWVVGSNLASPIISLARKADAVARGDFHQHMAPPDHAELGTLSNAFNNMAEELDRFSAEERRAREYALFLADIGEILTSTLDPQVALQSVTQRASDYFGSLVAVFEVREHGRLVKIASHAGKSEVLRAEDQAIRDRPQEVGSGVIGTVAASGETVFVPDVRSLANSEMRSYMERIGLQSEIAVPMKVHGEVIGAMLVASWGRLLARDDIPVVEDLARRIGVALENIRLYEDTLSRQRFLQALSDLAGAVSLTLEPRVVLSTICTKTREIMAADGVYVWVLREDEQQLVGEEACGYKAGEFVGMRLSLSETGVAAVQALAGREAFYINNVAASSDGGRALMEKFQTQSALFQPLISAGQPFGIMVIADAHDPERFDRQALDRSRLLAGYASAALANAREYVRERRIAEKLQRGLLPDIPPKVGKIEIAHFYTPARREAAVGGDFYDLIEVTETCQGVVIGDVSGKGLDAAVVTALVKYLLRAYVAEDPEPTTVLARTNNAVAKYTPADLFITLVYGVLNSGTGIFRFGNAGHEPTLVYRAADRSTKYLELPGMAAGLRANEEYAIYEVALARGDMMVMYTDGLTDARSASGEFLGQAGLAKLVSELAGRSAQDFLGRLITQVRDFTGGEFTDDVAVVVLRYASK